MSSLRNSLANLSGSRKLVLVGSILILLATFMPWHTIGAATLGNEKDFNAFGDQNFIIGLLAFSCALAALLLTLLPLLGTRLPRLPWKESTLFLFLGGETFLLIFVLTVMHATSLVRAVNYDLQLGIHLALLGSAFIFLGGYILKVNEKGSDPGQHELFVRPPRDHTHLRTPRQHESGSDTGKDKGDSRMRLDI